MQSVSQSIVLMLHKHALSVIEADYQSRHVSFVSQDQTRLPKYYYCTALTVGQWDWEGKWYIIQAGGESVKIYNCEVGHNNISNITLQVYIIRS